MRLALAFMLCVATLSCGPALVLDAGVDSGALDAGAPADAGTCESLVRDYTQTIKYQVTNGHNSGCTSDADCVAYAPRACMNVCPVAILVSGQQAFQLDVDAVQCPELPCIFGGDCLPVRAICDTGVCLIRDR